MKLPQETLETLITEAVDSSARKWTQIALENAICSGKKVGRRHVRAAVKELINLGRIGYVYELGSTYLARSLNKPMHLSHRLVLVPCNLTYQKTQEEAVLRLQPGVSFGDGRHPTTRIAAKGIEYAIRQLVPHNATESTAVLDIGTGTGVLLIAAVLLGAQKGIGVDIDDCAVYEARQNVALNQLSDRITIRNEPVEAIDAAFPIISANLRLPTLMTLCSWIRAHLATGGLVVLSGIRSNERQRLLGRYGQVGFGPVWSSEESTWAGVVLKRIVPNAV